MTGDHITFRCGHAAMNVAELNYSLRCPRGCVAGHVALLLPARGARQLPDRKEVARHLSPG